MKSNLEAGQLRKRLTPALYTVPVIERIEVRKRVVPPSRSCHVRGWNPVREGHPAVAFESLLECRVISALAKYPQLKSIASQPVSVTYQHLEKSVRYTTDLLVQFQSVPDELLHWDSA